MNENKDRFFISLGWRYGIQGVCCFFFILMVVILSGCMYLFQGNDDFKIVYRESVNWIQSVVEVFQKD